MSDNGNRELVFLKVETYTHRPFLIRAYQLTEDETILCDGQAIKARKDDYALTGKGVEKIPVTKKNFEIGYVKVPAEAINLFVGYQDAKGTINLISTRPIKDVEPGYAAGDPGGGEAKETGTSEKKTNPPEKGTT